MKPRTLKELERYDPDFHTTHNLPFLVSSSNPILDMINQRDKKYRFLMFQVGTCRGLFSYDRENYYILAIANDQPHNGHLQDVLEWFEHSCVRDEMDLVMLEVINSRFSDYLIRNGYKPWTDGTDNGLVKHHNVMLMYTHCIQ